MCQQPFLYWIVSNLLKSVITDRDNGKVYKLLEFDKKLTLNIKILFFVQHFFFKNLVPFLVLKNCFISFDDILFFSYLVLMTLFVFAKQIVNVTPLKIVMCGTVALKGKNKYFFEINVIFSFTIKSYCRECYQ